MQEDEAIIASVSPYGSLEAVLLQDDRVAHFYIRGAEGSPFGMKSCWVRNLLDAPEELDVEGMQEGIAPLLPALYCKNKAALPPFTRNDDLEIVWFPEGDGAALLLDGHYLAIIPSWSGYKEFNGYARDCHGESTLCWALQDDAVMVSRIKAAKHYWSSWEDDDNPWDTYYLQIIEAYEKVLGQHNRYFAIDGGYWPPKAIIRFDDYDRVYLFTVGLSLYPQPKVEMYFEEPSLHNRVELAACLSTGVGEDTIMEFAKHMSAQTRFPWECFTFLGFDHTMPCEAFVSHNELCHLDYLLFSEAPTSAPQFALPKIDDSPINLLWCIPITAEEQQLAEKVGVEALVCKLSSGQPNCLIKSRKSVV